MRHITELDVSRNTELKSLNCSYNDLTEPDVSQNTALHNPQLIEIMFYRHRKWGCHTNYLVRQPHGCRIVAI